MDVNAGDIEALYSLEHRGFAMDERRAIKTLLRPQVLRAAVTE